MVGMTNNKSYILFASIIRLYFATDNNRVKPEYKASDCLLARARTHTKSYTNTHNTYTICDAPALDESGKWSA